MSDGFKDEIRDRMQADMDVAELEDELGLSDHPYVKFFDAPRDVRGIVAEAVGGWADWP